MLDLALQWSGFVFLTLGALLHHGSTRASMSSFLFGATALFAWCCIQEVIPWGVACVQLVAMVTWAVNIGIEAQKEKKII